MDRRGSPTRNGESSDGSDPWLTHQKRRLEIALGGMQGMQGVEKQGNGTAFGPGAAAARSRYPPDDGGDPSAQHLSLPLRRQLHELATSVSPAES